MRFSIPLVVLACVLLAACGGGKADSTGQAEPSALVTLTRATRGSLPELVDAFGTAAPAPTGVVTISVPQPGQVTAMLVAQGATVRAGQPVVLFTVAPSARSSFLQAADALRAAEEQRRTTAQLLTQQLATRDQLVQADKAVADARAALAALRAQGAGAGTMTLRAPFAGVVTAVSASPGDRTQPGQALVAIAKSGDVVVTVGVDPTLGPRLRVGGPARLQRLDGSGAPIGGRIVRLHSILNPRTRQMDLDIGYPAGAILPGEALRVSLDVGTTAGWIVPHQSVVLDPSGKAHIFQAVAGKARAVPVTIAASTPNTDAVTGPVDPNRPVILDGAYQVADGTSVRTGAAK